MDTLSITQFHKASDLVHRHEVRHSVGKHTGSKAGVVRKGLRGVAIFPSPAVLQRLGQVPVKKRAVGLNSGSKQGVDNPFVEIDALLIRPAGTLGEDATPRN